MNPPPSTVRIHYLRPPNRREVFVQRLILDTPEVKITLAESVPFDPPIRIHGRIALERGSDAVWFTFPGRWHDIGRFHRADDVFTGFYANILTPPILRNGGIWETTDLFLDVWLDSKGRLSVLDEDQLQDALDRGWVSEAQARRASEEVGRIQDAHQKGAWPPPVVAEWTLALARQSLSSTTHAAVRRATSR